MHPSRGRSRPRHPARALTLLTAAAAVAGSLVSVAGAAPPASAAPATLAAPSASAANAACPWVGSSAPIATRVSQLLAKMSVAQKVTVLTGAVGQVPRRHRVLHHARHPGADLELHGRGQPVVGPAVTGRGQSPV